MGKISKSILYKHMGTMKLNENLECIKNCFVIAEMYPDDTEPADFFRNLGFAMQNALSIMYDTDQMKFTSGTELKLKFKEE